MCARAQWHALLWELCTAEAAGVGRDGERRLESQAGLGWLEVSCVSCEGAWYLSCRQLGPSRDSKAGK